MSIIRTVIIIARVPAFLFIIVSCGWSHVCRRRSFQVKVYLRSRNEYFNNNTVSAAAATLYIPSNLCLFISLSLSVSLSTSLSLSFPLPVSLSLSLPFSLFLSQYQAIQLELFIDSIKIRRLGLTGPSFRIQIYFDVISVCIGEGVVQIQTNFVNLGPFLY